MAEHSNQHYVPQFYFRNFSSTDKTIGTGSLVSVLVMVWTVIGASPPTGTLPTMIWRDWRRAISRQGLIEDMGGI